VLRGNVVLFVGAGINGGAKNGRSQPIKGRAELEKEIRSQLATAEEADLGELVAEFQKKLGGAEALHRFFRSEFSDCTPSDLQKQLLSYSWRRLYTLNVDDALERVARKGRAQTVRQVNRNDPEEDNHFLDDLEVIHLNGYVGNRDAGYVFTPEQYRAEMRRSSTWYSRCATDFFDKVFVFIGTSLGEPIFKAHIEELARTQNKLAAKSFLVTPDEVGRLKRESLLESRIDVVEGTLESFVEFLRSSVGPSLSPQQIAQRISGQEVSWDQSGAVAASVERLGSAEWRSRNRVDETRRRMLARDFFNGLAPSWQTVINDVGVHLSHDDLVLKSLLDFLNTDELMFVVEGQAGSGKTAALMKAATSVAIDNRAIVYSLNEQTRENLSEIVRYLARASAGKQSLLFINNLVIYADDLLEVEGLLSQAGVRIIGQCRSSDWGRRLGRTAPRASRLVNLPKLNEADYEQLRSGLLDYAVAPKFKGLETKERQLAYLKSCRQQLLVLMKEATQQRKFEEIIEDEFSRVQSSGSRIAFCIVGLATIAKNELTIGELQSVLKRVSPDYDAVTALAELGGIVEIGQNGLIGRHEIYVRHVMDLLVTAENLQKSLVGFLQHFVQFGQPVISRLNKQRGNLFKFLLNADWVYETFRRKRALDLAEAMYSAVELEYQRDGHYWLQRGLFYRKARKPESARDCLEKSISAFPQNDYAQHALAQQKLMDAARHRVRTSVSERDVREAVAALEKQDQRRGAIDEYALVTLAKSWGDGQTARELAREYFERLESLRKALPRVDKGVEQARIDCAKLATTGHWKRTRR